MDIINAQFEPRALCYGLKLAKGCLCRMMRKFDVKRGLVKNERCEVIDIKQNGIKIIPSLRVLEIT